MRLWRISDSTELTGVGGLHASGRWHSRGNRIVYLADHPASALLEILVHLEVDPEDLPDAYQLLAIDVPDDLVIQTIAPSQLTADWRDQPKLTRELGDRWLQEKRTPVLRVPSAIVPFASNWLLNPAHADAARTRIVEILRAPFDRRLL